MLDEPTDGELVARYRAGDEAAFAAMYRRHADALRTFATRRMHDWAAAEDVVQEVFLLASRRIGQLAEPARLRSWLYAIAARQAYSWLRDRRAHVSLEEAAATAGDDWEPADPAAGPEEAAAAAERLTMVHDAARGLSDEDRRVVRLLLQGLDGAGLAAACGIGTSHAYVQAHRARRRLGQALEAMLLARHGRACPALDALLAGWNGVMTPLLRKRVARHADRCAGCCDRGHRLLRPDHARRTAAPRPHGRVPLAPLPPLQFQVSARLSTRTAEVRRPSRTSHATICR